MQVTVKYGMEQITKTVDSGTTIGALRRDSNLKAVLGYGDNSKALINGVEMTDDVQLPNGCTVVMETRCNSKAV